MKALCSLYIELILYLRRVPAGLWAERSSSVVQVAKADLWWMARLDLVELAVLHPFTDSNRQIPSAAECSAGPIEVDYHVRRPRAQVRRRSKLRYILCTYNTTTNQLVYVIAV